MIKVWLAYRDEAEDDAWKPNPAVHEEVCRLLGGSPHLPPEQLVPSARNAMAEYKILVESRHSPSRWRFVLKALLVPLLLIFTSAWLGNWITSEYQIRAEEHSISFGWRLATIERAQEKAVLARTHARSLFSRLGTDEITGNLSKQHVNSAYEFLSEMEEVVAAVESIPDSDDAREKAVDAKKNVENYWRCLAKKLEDSESSIKCINSFDAKTLDKLVSACSSLTVNHYSRFADYHQRPVY